MKLKLLLLLSPIFTFGQWTQIGQNINGNASNDSFGVSVDISGDGSIMVACSNFNDNNSGNSGYIKAYENISGNWVQLGSDIVGLTPGDLGAGSPVSINNDGTIFIVGVPLYHTGGIGNSGYARVYEYISGNWVQKGSDLIGLNGGDRLGGSVSISSNGNIIAIGASQNGATGFARLYEYVSGSWIQIGTDIIGQGSSDRFGSSISLSNNGNIVAIGASSASGNGIARGTVRIYKNISGNWIQQGLDIDGESNSDRSGWSVSLSDDGNIVAIGSIYSSNDATDSGHVRVFENIANVWTQIGSTIEGADENDFFGSSLSLNSDGSIVAIGSFFHDPSGHVQVYQNQSANWTQIGADIDGEVVGDGSGYSVSLNSDGSILAIGARGNDTNGSNSGHVRVFSNALLSIEDNTFGSNFSVYPNPSNGVSKISLGATYGEVNLQIVDILGKVVSTQNQTNTNEVVLNTESYTSGIYFIKVQSGVKSATIKLVVN